MRTLVVVIGILGLSAASLASPSGKLVELVRLPGVRQATGYTCGTAATESILQYYGRSDLGEKELAKHMGSSWKSGTPPGRIARTLRHHGLAAILRTNMTPSALKSELRMGRPVIVDLQAWSEKPRTLDEYARDRVDGHYVVAIGFDQQHVYFMDPSIGGARGKLTFAELMPRWHDTDAKNRPRFNRLGIVVKARQRPVNEATYTQVQHID
jgi:predicted double-glycine peptidase